MTIILNLEDLPKFTKILHVIFILGSDILYIIGKNYKTLRLDEHLQAYEVDYCSNYAYFSFNVLLIQNSSCVLYTKSNERTYISGLF